MHEKHMCSNPHTLIFKVLYTIYPLYVINKQVDKTNFVSFLYYDGVLSECEWHRNNHIIPHHQHLKHALEQHKDYIAHPIQNGNTLFNTIYGVSMQQKSGKVNMFLLVTREYGNNFCILSGVINLFAYFILKPDLFRLLMFVN